jgi:hypothetical protein
MSSSADLFTVADMFTGADMSSDEDLFVALICEISILQQDRDFLKN